MRTVLVVALMTTGSLQSRPGASYEALRGKPDCVLEMGLPLMKLM